MRPLFKDSLTVINVGLAGFADNVVAAGGALRRARLAAAGAGRSRRRVGARGDVSTIRVVEQANARAFARFVEAQPVLVDIAPARDARAGHGRRPAADPARRSADRVAADVRADARRHPGRRRARRLGRFGRRRERASSRRGAIELAPCHHHARGRADGRASSARRCRCSSSRTGPRGNRAYCNMNEGLGKVLRFGANGPEVIERLRLMRGRARAGAARGARRAPARSS